MREIQATGTVTAPDGGSVLGRANPDASPAVRAHSLLDPERNSELRTLYEAVLQTVVDLTGSPAAYLLHS
eukprot:CAMPEP_0184360714 /NCGR_PEP_ID=MMETSP1089-20130417/126362_1 /TAXON_ID=38269 ORGANISM="Gloeochaete wittrockiana, Strain SAG46.84" /NCGR_SAMPLE_ID=MMETSP1089 /ASSEMBLY_ACC=CAM_ASM_000445 /LENGTH=69 /DNA_ID=CAMNT_0026700021 /DNA_START=42 /DNA_END=247 /DNA_ORIENTATION=-